MSNPILEGFRVAQAEAGRIAVEHGWKEEAVGTKIALMHAELSEALEEYRNGMPVTDVYYKGDKPEGVPIELADCIIRILSFAAGHGIDMGWAVALKMKFNDSRPFMHGGKKF